LSRGLISGHWQKGQGKAAGDFRGSSPRFQEGNVDQNLALVEELRKIADEKAAFPSPRSPSPGSPPRAKDIVPLVGARSRDRLTEALASRAVELSADDLAAIDRAVPKGAAAGGRYPAAMLNHMDSEK
jgi:aryl-alcohol dehydrogenase-like predicted oxidoreductase